MIEKITERNQQNCSIEITLKDNAMNTHKSVALLTKVL